MGKSAGPPTGYVAPGQQQQLPDAVKNYNGPLADQIKAKYGQQPGAFQQAAEAQAQANRPTQNTPFGSESWARDPATGAWTQNTSLAPGMQGALGGMQGQLSSAWGTPLDTGAQARQGAENAIYGRETARLDPQWHQRQDQMNAQLANQGLAPGSAAATATQDQFGRARNDAYSTAQQQAIMGGGQEAQRQQAMDLQSRMAPLQGMAGLRQLLSMPGFHAGPNYLAAVQGASNYNLQNTQQQNQQWGDYMSGLGQILQGGAAFA